MSRLRWTHSLANAKIGPRLASRTLRGHRGASVAAPSSPRPRLRSRRSWIQTHPSSPTPRRAKVAGRETWKATRSRSRVFAGKSRNHRKSTSRRATKTRRLRVSPRLARLARVRARTFDARADRRRVALAQRVSLVGDTC
jgi:hypothetical protein